MMKDQDTLLGKINWEAIYHRLSNVQAAFERDSHLDDHEKARILARRARALAKPYQHESDPRQSLTVTEFLLTESRCAIELAYIRDAYVLKEITAVPCTPPFIKGIINVRGQIIPVIDLKGFLGLPHKEHSAQNSVIIIRSADDELGILTDGILGVRSIPHQDIRPPLFAAGSAKANYVKGITIEPVIILDALKILADDHLVIHEEVDS